MKHPDHWYWAISIDTTKPALERLARALLLTGSGLECGIAASAYGLLDQRTAGLAF